MAGYSNMILTRTWKDKLRCLPQYLLGLIIRLVLKAEYDPKFNFKGRRVYRFKKGKFFSGTALFDTYLPYTVGLKTIAHEHGHHIDGDRRGWLYLPTSGIKSLRNNLQSRTAGWNKKYYHTPPEDKADEDGGVRHTYCEGEYCVREYP